MLCVSPLSRLAWVAARKVRPGGCWRSGCGRHTWSQSAISVLTLPIRFSLSLTTCTAWPGCKLACVDRRGLLANRCRAAVGCHRPARGGRAGASVQAGGWAYQHCWVFGPLEVVHGWVWRTRWAQTACDLDGREEASHQVAIGLWALLFGGSGVGRILASGMSGGPGAGVGFRGTQRVCGRGA